MRKLLLVLALSVASTVAFGQDLLVAAAADLNFVLPEIATRFEHKTGKRIGLTFGSSGNFYQQIRNGAPFDVFFSADEQYPAKLEQEGYAEPGTLYPYAQGKVVLALSKRAKLDASKGLALLFSPEVHRIAIANPQHAPYGRAAVEALQKEGLYDKVKDKFVLGENISQAAQFLQTGNADAGIIALSLTSAPGMRSCCEFKSIPEADYHPIRQAVMIVKSSKHKDVAREFLEFIRTDEVRNILAQYGFSAPGSTSK
jgi:molybdate transport system substrate-binding protein